MIAYDSFVTRNIRNLLFNSSMPIRNLSWSRWCSCWSLTQVESPASWRNKFPQLSPFQAQPSHALGQLGLFSNFFKCPELSPRSPQSFSNSVLSQKKQTKLSPGRLFTVLRPPNPPPVASERIERRFTSAYIWLLCQPGANMCKPTRLSDSCCRELQDRPILRFSPTP
jgi:hypothetical protein